MLATSGLAVCVPSRCTEISEDGSSVEFHNGEPACSCNCVGRDESEASIKTDTDDVLMSVGLVQRACKLAQSTWHNATDSSQYRVRSRMGKWKTPSPELDPCHSTRNNEIFRAPRQQMVAASRASRCERFTPLLVFQPAAAWHVAPRFPECCGHADTRRESFPPQDSPNPKIVPPTFLGHESRATLAELPVPESSLLAPLRAQPKEIVPCSEGRPSATSAGGSPPPRAVKLGGFSRANINTIFAESDETIGGCKILLSTSSEFLLFYNPTTKTWAVEKTKRLPRLRENGTGGVVYSPVGFCLFTNSRTTPKGWQEWNNDARRWEQRPGAGVVACGRIKPLTDNSSSCSVCSL
eukprot:TRINITY_DN44541_c0_g1_i1.p1 TRINITY_DN44541_c0_g1~~TRINITY_DN44541_c0_g1_i1.p1  ORF type:complete len:409 (+),score=38.66 TRINITY_DN44541_c0_g1_i1:174-1229(+)